MEQTKDLLQKAKEENDKALEALQKEFFNIRGGRISAELLDGVKVSVYGSFMPISSIGNVTVCDPRTLCVIVWDASNVKFIESGLQQSTLGFSLRTEGVKIFASLPEMSQERRVELIKIVRKKAEEIRVRIRNIRRDLNDAVKKLKSESKISEDLSNQTLEMSQKITDSFIEKVDIILQIKEKDLSSI